MAAGERAGVLLAWDKREFISSHGDPVTVGRKTKLRRKRNPEEIKKKNSGFASRGDPTPGIGLPAPCATGLHFKRSARQWFRNRKFHASTLWL